MPSLVRAQNLRNGWAESLSLWERCLFAYGKKTERANQSCRRESEPRFCAEFVLIAGSTCAKPLETAQPFRGVDSYTSTKNKKDTRVGVFFISGGGDDVKDELFISLRETFFDLFL